LYFWFNFSSPACSRASLTPSLSCIFW
jgi:hypothetical protein